MTDVPEAFKDWVRDNEERIETAEKRGTQPYFIRDNKEYIQGILKPAEAKKTALEIAAERHAARTQEDIDRIQSDWNTNRLNHLMELSERIGSYRDADFREWASLLDSEISLKEFRTFKADYKMAKQYVDNKIAEQTAMSAKFMENSANAANMRDLVKALGVEQREYMTFFEANVLRGNPNYAVSEAYQINCETCVVAHELRRRGFNIEALANTAGSWSEKQSRMTNDIWLDANGNMPKKTTVGAEFNYVSGITPGGRRFKSGWQKTVSNRRKLIKELEASITEEGRYHIDWFWNTQSKRYLSGHIITLEKIGDAIRYYDPQNGKVIDNFHDYISDIMLRRGIRVLRVDNLRINTEYASHILGKSGSNAVGGKIGKGGFSGVQYPISNEIKVRRSEIRNIAKETIVDKPIDMPGLNKIATISNKGVKEWTNQPHTHLAEKNELILDIQNVLNKSKYLGCGPDKNSINAIAHLYETVINGDKSWIIAREFYDGKIVIHSISDSREILKIIKASTR